MASTPRNGRAPTVPLWRECAMAMTPLALPTPYPVPRRMPLAARRDAKRANQRHLQRYMALYILRSAWLLAGAFFAFQFCVVFLPFPVLIVPLGSLVLLVVVHLAGIIFWKQHLDDCLGPLERRD